MRQIAADRRAAQEILVNLSEGITLDVHWNRGHERVLYTPRSCFPTTSNDSARSKCLRAARLKVSRSRPGRLRARVGRTQVGQADAGK